MSGAPRVDSEAQEVRRWADHTRAATRVLLLVLAVAVVAAVSGQRWSVWVGFAVAGVAAIGAVRCMTRLTGPSTTVVQAAPRAARRRVVRAVRRGESPAAGDEALTVATACTALRTTTSGMWVGLLIAGSQVSGLVARGGPDTVRLGLLLIAVLLALANYAYSGRLRCNLHPAARTVGLAVEDP